MKDQEIEELDKAFAYKWEKNRVHLVQLKYLFKEITTWDVTWMMVKCIFASFFAFPVFLAVLFFWVILIPMIFGLPTYWISNLVGLLFI